MDTPKLDWLQYVQLSIFATFVVGFIMFFISLLLKPRK